MTIGKRRIRVGVREALEPAVRSRRRLDQGERPFGRSVVDDVELVVLLQDHPLVRWAGIDVRDILRAGLAEAGERRTSASRRASAR